MRQIKFRGIDVKTGKFVYGDLISSPYKGKIIYEIRTHIQHKQNAEYSYPRYTTVKDSIAQLVGHDSNGDEVYEGDTLIDEYGDENIADFYPLDTESMTLKEVLSWTLTRKNWSR